MKKQFARIYVTGSFKWREAVTAQRQVPKIKPILKPAAIGSIRLYTEVKFSFLVLYIPAGSITWSLQK